MLFTAAWMDLEIVIQSEVSQKETYQIIPLICGTQKNGTDELICKAEIATDVEKQTYSYRGGKVDEWVE